MKMKVFLVWEYTSEYCDMYDERNNHMDHVFETKEKAEQYLKSKGYSYKDHWHDGYFSWYIRDEERSAEIQEFTVE